LAAEVRYRPKIIRVPRRAARGCLRDAVAERIVGIRGGGAVYD
jgi:hypothetical protein